jgi:hypothetical protein
VPQHPLAADRVSAASSAKIEFRMTIESFQMHG